MFDPLENPQRYRDRRENAAVVAVRRGEAELVEDVRHVLLHDFLCDEKLTGDRGVGPALREQGENFPLAGSELRECVAAPCGVQQADDMTAVVAGYRHLHIILNGGHHRLPFPDNGVLHPLGIAGVRDIADA